MNTKATYICKYCRNDNTAEEHFNGMIIVICKDCKVAMMTSETEVVPKYDSQCEDKDDVLPYKVRLAPSDKSDEERKDL